jgi:hypothetical protein
MGDPPEKEKGKGKPMSEETNSDTHASDHTDTRSATYAELAAVGPYGVHPGHALITMVEPHPGHEYAYNRWYEDDHYYAGAMAMPWMYAGRRWVATRDLHALDHPYAGLGRVELLAPFIPAVPGTDRYVDRLR